METRNKPPDGSRKITGHAEQAAKISK
jgi:hypothetical protein